MRDSASWSMALAILLTSLFCALVGAQEVATGISALGQQPIWKYGRVTMYYNPTTHPAGYPANQSESCCYSCFVGHLAFFHGSCSVHRFQHGDLVPDGPDRFYPSENTFFTQRCGFACQVCDYVAN